MWMTFAPKPCLCKRASVLATYRGVRVESSRCPRVGIGLFLRGSGAEGTPVVSGVRQGAPKLASCAGRVPAVERVVWALFRGGVR